MNNPKPISNGVSGSYILACIKSGKKHNFKCLSSTDGYFGCGKSGKKVKIVDGNLARVKMVGS